MKKYLLILPILVSASTIFGQNIKKEKLDSLLKKAEETHSEAIIIYQDNKLISEKYFGIGKPETKIEAMSATKSIVGLAVACMLSDGLLDSLDVPVCKFYPEWRQGQKQNITIRHLVNMTSGIQNNRNTTVEIYPSDNFVQLALAAELSDKPGSIFAYNNKSLNLMAGVIQKITGKRMDAYIGERLFKPLGISDFTWSLDSAGNPHAMSGCQIMPRDFVKIGLLLLNNGKFNDNQIISEKSISLVVSPCKQYEGYGMLWWINYERIISTIDDEIINEFKNAKLDEEFINKTIKLKGVYNNHEDYLKKKEEVFGKNPDDYITKNLKGMRFRKKEFEMTYNANGYLGQHLIVNPKTKVVAIRMISEESYIEDKDGKDGFIEFKSLVNNLTN